MKYGKTLLAVAVALMMLVLPASVMLTSYANGESANSSPGYDPADDIEYYFYENSEKTEHTAYITGYANTEFLVDLVIPDKVKHVSTVDWQEYEYNVCFWEWPNSDNPYYGFKDCTTLRSVTLNSTMTCIGKWSFMGCTALETVHIPSNITAIRYNAFQDCTSLKTVDIAENINCLINGYVFEGCTSLESIFFPAGIYEDDNEKINSPFSGCTSLKKIEVAESNSKFKAVDGMLYNKAGTDLIQYPAAKAGETFDIPSDVTTIREGAMIYSQNLKTVNIHSGVTSIGIEAFAESPLLTAINMTENEKFKTDSDGALVMKVTAEVSAERLLQYPSGKTGTYTCNYEHVSNGALRGSKLTEVSMPNLKEIVPTYESEDWYKCSVFRDCDALTTVTIGGTIELLPKYTFSGLENLKTVNMPTITKIGKYAFEGCIGITSINLTNIISVGDGAFKGTGLTSVVIPATITTMGANVFEDCLSLTTATVNGASTSFGCFKGCTSLKTLSMPDVTRLGDYTFNGCTSITSIDMSKITEIGNDVFSGCTGITSIDLSKVTSIGNGAFIGTSLTSVTIPNAVTSIGWNTFENCRSLKTVTLHAGLTTINGWSFNGCSSLESIDLSNVTKLVQGAFCGCSSLKSVDISKVTEIEQCTFLVCENLETVTISPDLGRSQGGSEPGIGASAFAGCSSLKSIDIPTNSNTIWIGNFAFDGCSSLTSLNIPANVLQLGWNSFQLCTGLKTVTFADGADIPLRICGYAFYGCSGLTEVTLPYRITESYGGQTVVPFLECSSLESISISQGTTSYTNYIFTSKDGVLYVEENGTKYLVQYPNAKKDTTFTIPSGVAKLQQGSFRMNAYLETLDIGSEVTDVLQGALSGCTALKSINATGNANYSSANGVLFNKEGTELVQYPAGKEDVSYAVPDTVTTINQDAFSECTHLTEVSFKSSITLGDGSSNVFGTCTNLKKFVCTGTADDGYYTDNNGNLCYKDEVKNLFVCPVVRTGNIVLEDGLTEIMSNAFEECEYDNIFIPASVGYIPSNAFPDTFEFYENDKKTEITDLSQLVGATLTKMDSNDDETVKYFINGPLTTITEPADGSTVNTSKVTVKGETLGVKVSVFVNGTEYQATLSGGVYSADVTLKAGANVIKVVATGADGLTYEKSITITYVENPTPSSDSGSNYALLAVFIIAILAVLYVAIVSRDEKR